MFWMTGRGKGRGRDKRLNLDVSFPERRLGSDAERSGCNGFAYAFTARIRIIPWRLPGKWKEDIVMSFASCPWPKCSHVFISVGGGVGFLLLFAHNCFVFHTTCFKSDLFKERKTDCKNKWYDAREIHCDFPQWQIAIQLGHEVSHS